MTAGSGFPAQAGSKNVRRASERQLGRGGSMYVKCAHPLISSTPSTLNPSLTPAPESDQFARQLVPVSMRTSLTFSSYRDDY